MGVWGVLAWVSARQTSTLSVENNGKWHGKKTPTVQSTSHTKPTRILASLHSGCYLGWLLLVSLRRLLFIRFLVVPRSRCHSVTVNRSKLNTPPTSTRIPSPHAPAQPSRLYSFMRSMQRAHSQISPPTFPCNRILDAPFLASYLATRLLVHHISLWAPCEDPSSFDHSFAGCTGVHLPPTWPAESPEGSHTVRP